MGDVSIEQAPCLVAEGYDSFLAPLAQNLQAPRIQEEVLHFQSHQLSATQSCVEEEPDHGSVAATDLQIEVEAGH
jgi:hypothetical protein